MKTEVIWIGAHTSAAGGVHNAIYEGQDIGATTIQLFTANQRQWHSHLISDDEVLLWEKAKEETGIKKIMSHAGYLINLGSSNPEILAKSRKAFLGEIERCHRLKIDFLTLHPGTATDGNREKCLETIIESLRTFSKAMATGPTRLLLETTAGQGHSVGHHFEELGVIVNAVKKDLLIGITIDTCHIFAAGYDIRTEKGWENSLEAFDKNVGLEHLYAFHLNDSVKDLGCHVDRHAPIGKGKIGIESFHFLMTHKLTRSLPKYLETPDGPTLWKKEIAMLKHFVEKG